MCSCVLKNKQFRKEIGTKTKSLLVDITFLLQNYVDVRSSDIDAYSQFDGDVLASLSTAL